MDDSIIVRRARREDEQAWAKMRHDLWPSSSAEKHLREIREFWERTAEANFVAVNQKNKAVLGFMELSIRPFANGCDTRNVAFLEGIWVQRDFRLRGIGRQLVMEAERWAVEQGCQELGSDAEIHNADSYKAHLAWGFEETSASYAFERD
jgi:aminoglycoside 6'-N-acetyltransferase I